MTTVATERFHRWDFHPLERQLASLHRLCHILWLTITTGGLPGWSSLGVNARPAMGATPSIEKKPEVAYLASTLCGSASPVRLNPCGMSTKQAIWEKLPAQRLKS